MSKGEQKPPGESPRRFKRKLTPFLCHEMLYDFATDQLDGERREAVEEFIKTDNESQSILESIRNGLAYAEQVSQAKLKPELLDHLKESENVISLGKRYSSWKEWPETLRWSLTAIFISVSIAGVVAIVPWSRLPQFKKERPSDMIEVAQIPKPSDEQAAQVAEESEVDQGSGDEVVFEGEETELPAKPTQVAQNKKGPPTEHSGDEHLHEYAGDSDYAPPSSGSSSKQVAPTMPPPQPAQQNAGAARSAMPEDEDTGTKEAKPKGFVYRAFMTLNDLEVIGPKIAENVRELGGEKAGEVELGWRRGTGRYYHFSLPEVNEEKILDRLRVYGPVRISKDPHPRVMPKGQVRFILWVESAN